MTPHKYEYDISTIVLSDSSLEDYLNMKGDDGWELILYREILLGSTEFLYIIFKRVKDDLAQPLSCPFCGNPPAHSTNDPKLIGCTTPGCPINCLLMKPDKWKERR